MNGEYISIETLRIIQSLENENKRLSTELEIEKDISDVMLETIDKAIKYIEEAQKRDEDKESCSLYVPKLLEILRGDENGNKK